MKLKLATYKVGDRVFYTSAMSEFRWGIIVSIGQNTYPEDSCFVAPESGGAAKLVYFAGIVRHEPYHKPLEPVLGGKE